MAVEAGLKNEAVYEAIEVILNEFKKPKDFLAEMNKVTSTDILKLAKDLFVNDGLNLAIIGPMKENAKLRRIVDLSK